MFRKFTATLTVASLLALLGTTSAFAGDSCVINPAKGYYAESLHCTFVVREMNYKGMTVTAARLCSNPEQCSPLKSLNLKMGDVIFRLDGVPVDNDDELDDHYDWTTVRYSRNGTAPIQNGKIFINNSFGGDNQP
ncbi:MAG: hypothetical protein KDA68_16550 [Planctomycetaceae bacterium]|nr:hypothetical protein [Planctomycetaceae bacterium]